MEQLGIDRGDLIPKKKRPNLTFEDGSYTLPELLESHLLPVVAQYDVSRQPIPFHEFNFDLSQPLLLYKKRHIQKVAAHSLYIKDDKYEEVGETILVPEDYKGWFAVLQRLTGNIKADDAVPHFTTIEELANSNTDRFLIGGTKKINGIQLFDTSDPAQQKHEQRQFLPGDLLTREKIFYGETKKRSRLFRKTKYITEKFLKCRDESDREILLPFEQAGIFYQVSHKHGKPNKNVMQMSDIVARKLTPRIIKLVFGRFPVTPCSFTGLMRAESSNIETSIIASTMVNTKNILMEIPVSSAIYFRVAIMNNDLRKNECYRNAMSVCVERAITYMRNIKVCYNFTLDDGVDNEGALNEQLNAVSYTKEECVNNNDEPTRDVLDECKGAEPQTVLRSQLRKSYFKALSAPRVFSVDIPDDVSMRPARCLSASRMSFCLGNNYLTVPLLEPSIYKRNSGNNNSINEVSCTTRRGSRISFNGTFFEEESGDELENTDDDTDTTNIPPSLPSTNIGSYMNSASPMRDSSFADFVPSPHRRPSTQPPDTAPPPLPRSSSTSGISSGSLTPSHDGNGSSRGSADSFEYAVPKIQESSTSVSDVGTTLASNVQDKDRVRRPSTFTFSEGCFVGSRSSSRRPGCETIVDEEADNGCPIYENIQALKELVSKMDENAWSQNNDGTEEGFGENCDSAEECATEAIPNDQESISLDNETSLQGDDLHVMPDHTPENTLDDTGYSFDDSDKLDKNVKEISFSSEVLDCLFAVESSREETMTLVDTHEDDKCSSTMRTRRTGVISMPTMVDSAEITENDCAHVKAVLSENNAVIIESSESIKTTTTQTITGRNIADEDGFDNKSDIQSNTIDNEKSIQTESDEMPVSDPEHANPCQENAIITLEEIDKEKHTKSDSGNTDSSPPKEDFDGTDNVYLWKKALEKIKHSDELLISKAKIKTPEKPLNTLTVDEVAETLTDIGIKSGTIEQIKTLQVDGERLYEVVEGELSIRDCLTGVNLVDQQKISMFIRGWRPNSSE